MVATGQPLEQAFVSAEALPANLRVDTSALGHLYLRNGQVKKWDGPTKAVQSPVCVRQGGKLERITLGAVPQMDEAMSLAALEAATEAWNLGRGTWPTMSVADRIRCVERFVDRMVAQRDPIVKLLMWEIGKSLADSGKEFDRTVEYLRGTIEALKSQDRANSRFSLDQGVIAQVRRSPLGVCLCMGPFNYPLNETFTTLIPALIMGNTLVVKPPKIGALLHQPLLEAFAECFPPGVVNYVYGDGPTIISPIMQSGRVDVLAFIGSSRVADILKHQHPHPHRMRAILGLDAKNPALVMADADLDLAVNECVTGSLSFNGQRCTALKLIFVHESIADLFVQKLSAAVDALPVGMPWEQGVKITPLAEPGKPETLAAMIKDACGGGAKVMNKDGGQSAGTLMRPAVVYPVAAGAKLYSVEQFGPVVPVRPYKREEEVLDFIARSEYGQQISLFGRDPSKLAALIDPLANQVCRINLNAQCQRGPDSLPFTGRKSSAEGTLSIDDALKCFSIRSLVAGQQTDAGRQTISQIVSSRHSRFLNTDFIL